MMMCFKINVHAKLFKMIIVLEPLITQDFIFVGNNFHVWLKKMGREQFEKSFYDQLLFEIETISCFASSM